MTYKIRIERRALKELKKVPAAMRERITKVVLVFGERSDEGGAVKG